MARHVGRGVLNEGFHLSRRQRRLGLQNEGYHPRQVGRGHRSTAHVRVERQLAGRQHGDVGLGTQRGYWRDGAGRNHIYAGGNDNGLVFIGPGFPIDHERALLAPHTTGRETGQQAVAVAGTHRNGPGRNGVGVVRVGTGAGVAGRENHHHATVVALFGGHVQRVVRIELARAAKGVADDPDIVLKLVRQGIIKAADGIEHQQRAARAVAQQRSTGRHAFVLPGRPGPVAAHRAGAVRAVARVGIRIRHAFDVRHRQHGILRVQVGRAQRVLHQVRAQLNVVVGAVHAAVVDEHANATAGNRGPAVAGRRLGVEAQPLHARQVRIVVVVIIKLFVDVE